ncbi:uncharacterized protein LOC123403035 [Hordeum vulgare subsp. vulgare]|uniref:uncharacterized protein LOC123403035 n=1 Tax=Hordeum vulgare subsp. vulgare TaxID=112509 RepID=UPI001D1A51B7|nr:uncharacterized protein LOC123403035 [Hordeum vulgare subsp. vulgare]
MPNLLVCAAAAPSISGAAASRRSPSPLSQPSPAPPLSPILSRSATAPTRSPYGVLRSAMGAHAIVAVREQALPGWLGDVAPTSNWRSRAVAYDSTRAGAGCGAQRCDAKIIARDPIIQHRFPCNSGTR